MSAAMTAAAREKLPSLFQHRTEFSSLRALRPAIPSSFDATSCPRGNKRFISHDHDEQISKHNDREAYFHFGRSRCPLSIVRRLRRDLVDCFDRIRHAVLPAVLVSICAVRATA